MTDHEMQSATGEKDKTLVCAWCGKTMHQGGPTAYLTHGICLSCMGETFQYPTEDVSALAQADADSLPYGLIRLDGQFEVIEYNTQESAISHLSRDRVMGRSFFKSVAPCTCVQDFEGKVQQLRSAGQPGRDKIQFLFKFPARITMVEVAMIYDPGVDQTTLLIRKVKEEPDENAMRDQR